MSLEIQVFDAWFIKKMPNVLNDGPLKDQVTARLAALDPDNHALLLALMGPP